MTTMLPCDIQAVRIEVFHAALRVKYYMNHPDGNTGSVAQALGREVERMGLVIEYAGHQMWVVDGRLLVCVSRNNYSGEARAVMRQRGLALGLLVDFNKDLMVDGVVTVEGEGEEKDEL